MPRSAAPTWCYVRDAVALLGAPAPRHPGHAPMIALQPRFARLRPVGAQGVDLCDVATESCRGLRRAHARRMAGPPPSGGRASSAAVFCGREGGSKSILPRWRGLASDEGARVVRHMCSALFVRCLARLRATLPAKRGSKRRRSARSTPCWPGRWAGAQDITSRSANPKGAKRSVAVVPPSEAQRNDWGDFAECDVMLNREAIYPRPAVPLRCARSAPDCWRSAAASDAGARVVCLDWRCPQEH